MLTYQRRMCEELLKLELEEFRPANVVIIASGGNFNWYVDELVNHLNIHIKSTGETHVTGIGAYGETRVILTRRPEGQTEKEFVSEVLKFITAREIV